jgi:hypothetical protein
MARFVHVTEIQYSSCAEGRIGLASGSLDIGRTKSRYRKSQASRKIAVKSLIVPGRFTIFRTTHPCRVIRVATRPR